MICGCGRIGTIHEFTIAFEDGKPIGIFEGPWETGDELKEIIAKGHRENDKIAISDDPKKIVADTLALVRASKVEEYKITA